jgi:hypothetical protein
MFWENWTYNKPAWKKDYEFYEDHIAKRTGLDKRKLQEVVNIMIEYKILNDEG